MSLARVNIIGASGTGKTTLGMIVASQLGVPYLDSDVYYHAPAEPPYTRPREAHERLQRLNADLSRHPGWVLSGAVELWVPAPRLEPTLRVLLWLPPPLRLARLVARERARFGARVLPGGDMHDAHASFLAWTTGYDEGTCEGTNTRAHHEDLLQRSTCPVLRLEGPDEVEARAAQVVAAVRAARAL